MSSPRIPPRHVPEKPAPDPADQGTAFGMDLSIGGAAADKPVTPESDPLHWIRQWLQQHPPE